MLIWISFLPCQPLHLATPSRCTACAQCPRRDGSWGVSGAGRTASIPSISGVRRGTRHPDPRGSSRPCGSSENSRYPAWRSDVPNATRASRLVHFVKKKGLDLGLLALFLTRRMEHFDKKELFFNLFFSLTVYQVFSSFVKNGTLRKKKEDVSICVFWLFVLKAENGTPSIKNIILQLVLESNSISGVLIVRQEWNTSVKKEYASICVFLLCSQRGVWNTS